jgi:hypothetical protein
MVICLNSRPNEACPRCLRRYTNDFDLTLAPDGWDELADRLARTGLFAGPVPVEGHSADKEALRAALAEKPR